MAPPEQQGDQSCCRDGGGRQAAVVPLDREMPLAIVTQVHAIRHHVLTEEVVAKGPPPSDGAVDPLAWYPVESVELPEPVEARELPNTSLTASTCHVEHNHHKLELRCPSPDAHLHPGIPVRSPDVVEWEVLACALVPDPDLAGHLGLGNALQEQLLEVPNVIDAANLRQNATEPSFVKNDLCLFLSQHIGHKGPVTNDVGEDHLSNWAQSHGLRLYWRARYVIYPIRKDACRSCRARTARCRRRCRQGRTA
mmetsp:Transcript_77844/g.210459  ORF Transcript_77844/g.210459 Transcript_77844/m.210459 type:complete len:252 (+) Transcript_77844:759-1514(+)